MGVKIPPAGAIGILNWRDINTPVPNCTFVDFG